MSDHDDASFRRLGKQELGPYAFEDRMPSLLVHTLDNEGDENKTTSVIPKLAQLLQPDDVLETAFLCDTSVVQVSKLPNEGNTFCGYRNMQMILSGLSTVREPLEWKDLTVPRLQEMIEKAWDAGFNDRGRTETGGILGTRKYVGSSEVEAVLLHLGLQCTGKQFEGKQAHVDLLDFVEKYFLASQTISTASPIVKHTKVHVTAHHPIFLQRPKHSMTIVGFEKLKNGKRRLLVFDPAWQPPSMMRQTGVLATSSTESTWSRAIALWRYRKHGRYLRRFAAFETVSLDADVAK